jgi:hypothetical protein
MGVGGVLSTIDVITQARSTIDGSLLRVEALINRHWTLGKKAKGASIA